MSQEPDGLPATPDEQGEGQALPLIELETLLNRPPSRRKRLLQLGLVLVALVVVLVTFWDVIIPQKPPLLPAHVQPTQAPPTFTIVSNVNYGTIAINGQPQRGSVPLTVTTRQQPPYTITLDAPPFQPFTCRYPPPDPGTPLTFLPCNEGGVLTPNGIAEHLLELLFTLDALPAAQQQQVIAAILQGVTTRQDIGVPAGSLIITGFASDGTARTRRTTEPLRASAFLVPVAQDGQNGLICTSFICTEGIGGFLPDFPGSGHLWEVMTPITLRWRFTTASGQVVSDVTFPALRPITLDLSYQAATDWQLAPLPSNEGSMNEQLAGLVCEAGGQMLGIEQARYLSGEGWEIKTLSDAGVAGCKLALTQNGADQGHFVWRFGALLAADAKARALFPTLPIASSADLAAVGASA